MIASSYYEAILCTTALPHSRGRAFALHLITSTASPSASSQDGNHARLLVPLERHGHCSLATPQCAARVTYTAVVDQRWTRPLRASPIQKLQTKLLPNIVSLHRYTTTQQLALAQKQWQLGREAARAANALWCALNENH